MATNDLYKKITKQIFKGNLGLQLQLLRKKVEVLEFKNYCKENNIEINELQQDYINKVNQDYDLYNNQIKNMLGETSVYDLKP